MSLTVTSYNTGFLLKSQEIVENSQNLPDLGGGERSKSHLFDRAATLHRPVWRFGGIWWFFVKKVEKSEK